MELSAFTLKLIILLVPGALGAILLERLTIRKREWSPFKFIVNAILIGLFAYAFDELIVRLWNLLPARDLYHISIFKSLADTKDSAIPWGEVMIASVTGVIIGIVLIKGDNNKWLNRVAQYFKISYKYGDENLFTYYLRGQTEYVYVRCSRQGFTYKGLIKTYSETDEMKELVIEDVEVYDYETSGFLYKAKQVYVSLLKDDLIIELPNIPENEPENPTSGTTEV